MFCFWGFFFASLLAAFSHIHTPYITRDQLKWDSAKTFHRICDFLLTKNQDGRGRSHQTSGMAGSQRTDVSITRASLFSGRVLDKLWVSSISRKQVHLNFPWFRGSVTARAHQLCLASLE